MKCMRVVVNILIVIASKRASSFKCFVNTSKMIKRKTQPMIVSNKAFLLKSSACKMDENTGCNE